ncbi:MAG: ROK family transcriptional regulator [Actinomycetaceae bacterium]|nr:ROK family transcriptional regulator [Arcanobacterium sp.]MDD7505283.1 ROK family transcriptional regulator [Actinomycetaceae bacterium]MDY6143412.1 ROK family transcriptional regulator [Arcanobacterium sp.]
MYYQASESMSELEKKILFFLAQGRATRSEIASAVGISRTQLARVVPHLLSSGAVAVVGAVESSHGRRAELLEIPLAAAAHIGIAVSRMDISCVVINHLEECLYKKTRAHIAMSESEFVHEIIEFIRELRDECHGVGVDIQTAISCGVTLPFPLPLGGRVRVGAQNSSQLGVEEKRAEYDGVTAGSSQLARHLAASVQKQLPGVSVLVDNTMRMGALGEVRFGAGAQHATQIYVGISGGVAATVTFNRRLLYGENGIGGELGHVNVPGESTPCQCGKTGCLETVLAYRFFCRRAGVKTVSELRDAYLAKDPQALKAVDDAVRALAHALAGTVLTLGFTFIILGGSVSAEFPELVELVEHRLSLELFPSPQWRLSVSQATLGSWAPAWGAAIGYRALREERI